MAKSRIVKLAILVVIIIAVPVFFFQYIGENPMTETEADTTAEEDSDEGEVEGAIAVVNEDSGYNAEGVEEPLLYGQDIMPTLQEGSEYEWSVMGRSSAQAGLQDQAYDAVVYIGTTFSEDVMSFTDEVPDQAGVRYEIHNNLDAENQQRVQNELENAQQKMNRQISTQYWQYVTEEINGVRANFEEVLEKEIEFLDEMYDFYAPSSQALANEIDQQRNTLSQLFENTSEADDLYETSHSDLETAQQAFEGLLDGMNEYRDYQEDQADTLVETSTENESIVDDTVTNFRDLMEGGRSSIADTQTPYNPELDNEGDDVFSFLQIWNRGADFYSDRLGGLGEEMQGAVDTSTGALSQIPDTQREMLDDLAEESESLFWEQYSDAEDMRWGLTDPPEDRGPERPEAPEEGLDSINSEVLYEAKDRVEEMGTHLEKLRPEEPEEPEPEPEEPEEKNEEEGNDEEDNGEDGDEGENDENEPVEPPSSNEDYDKLREAWDNANHVLQELEHDLADAGSAIEENGEWTGSFLEYYGELLEYIEEIEQLWGNVSQPLVEHIEEREEAVFDRLPDYLAFDDDPIENEDPVQLMDYYGELVALDLALDQVTELDEEAIDELNHQTEMVQGQLDDIDGNLSSVSNVQEGIDESALTADEATDALDEFVADTNSLLADIEEAIAEEQQLIMEDLDGVLDTGQNIQGSLQEDWNSLEADPGPVDELDGQLVYSNQQSSLGEIQQLGGQVESLGDRQDDLVSSTEEMYGSVESVQEEADDLSARWSDNVNNTEMVHEDVNTILANASTDGYHNDYVYSHLSNPVGVSGASVDQTADTSSQSSQSTESESTSTTPPIVMLIIILITSLLIGYLTHHYSSAPLSVNVSLFLILSIVVGLIISIYGLNIYSMSDGQALQWTTLTVLLIIATAGIVRLAFTAGPFIGWIVSVGLMLFFVTPLLDMAMPNFSTTNPVAELYMSIQYGSQVDFVAGTIVLGLISLLVLSVPFIQKALTNSKEKSKEEEYYEA